MNDLEDTYRQACMQTEICADAIAQRISIMVGSGALDRLPPIERVLLEDLASRWREADQHERETAQSVQGLRHADNQARRSPR